MSGLRRFFERLNESDESRLAAEIREWAGQVDGAVAISEAPRRSRVKIAGVVRRLTVFPMRDNEALDVVLVDGTGEIVVRFMGRRTIGGLGLGTKVVVEGVIGEHLGVLQMMNPALELTA